MNNKKRYPIVKLKGPAFIRGTIIAWGYNDAIRLRRRFGGQIFGGSKI